MERGFLLCCVRILRNLQNVDVMCKNIQNVQNRVFAIVNHCLPSFCFFNYTIYRYMKLYKYP